MYFDTISNSDDSFTNKDSKKKYLEYFLIVTSMIFFISTLPISLLFTLKTVKEYERVVVFRLGRLSKEKSDNPGLLFILPCIENYARVDLRVLTYNITPQEVLTKDLVTISVEAVVYYKIVDAINSVTNVKNAHLSTRFLAQTALRNMLSTNNLQEILSDSKSITEKIKKLIKETTDNWGISIEKIELKDVRLPSQLQRSMAAEAEAAREAKAKFISAEGEQKSSYALKEATEILTQSPTAFQLRYLQTLTTICSENESTIIFPLPIDMKYT